MVVKAVALTHLILLGLWGGVVATEAVLELYPRRRMEMHPYTIRAHYWIDLLVELPILLGVALSGMVLLGLSWPPTPWHLIKICCGGLAVGANLVCIVLVLRRHKMLAHGDDDKALWSATRRISLTAVMGIPLALAAAILGFWLASQRLG